MKESYYSNRPAGAAPLLAGNSPGAPMAPGAGRHDAIRAPRTRHPATEPSMSEVITQQAGRALRASDGERDQVVAQLQRHFADGRLTQAELEERVGAALAARTRDQLRALTADLPGADVRPARPAMALDPVLLCVLACLCPPAGAAYWLLS